MFHIEQHHPTQALHTGITIAMGVIKPQNMEWVIQKATELGADCLIPSSQRERKVTITTPASKNIGINP